MIMCYEGGGLVGMAFSQGNAPLGSIKGLGERAAVSILSTIAITCLGILVMIPVSGSRSAERY
jgi:hypothetical protein